MTADSGKFVPTDFPRLNDCARYLRGTLMPLFAENPKAANSACDALLTALVSFDDPDYLIEPIETRCEPIDDFLREGVWDLLKLRRRDSKAAYRFRDWLVAHIGAIRKNCAAAGSRQRVLALRPEQPLYGKPAATKGWYWTFDRPDRTTIIEFLILRTVSLSTKEVTSRVVFERLKADDLFGTRDMDDATADKDGFNLVVTRLNRMKVDRLLHWEDRKHNAPISITAAGLDHLNKLSKSQLRDRHLKAIKANSSWALAVQA